MSTPRRTRRLDVLIPVAGLGATELLAAVLPGLPSPTGAVASLLVTGTPGPVATAFLQLFRGAARPLTVVAAALLLVVALSAAYAVVLRLIAGPRPSGEQRTSADGEADGEAEGEVAGQGTTAEPGDERPGTALPRRALLAGLGVGGIVLVGAALLLRPRSPDLHVALAGRMRAARGLPPLTAAQDRSPEVPGLSPTLTPVERFFRIDTAIVVPRVDVRSWRLTVDGLVRERIELDMGALLDLGVEEHDATICCVSNDVGGPLVGTARWTGVPLSRVLALAGPLPDADQLVGRSVDDWTAGFPTVLASAPDVLVAVGMNGIELPPRHGYPARLIVPGLYGYVSATKWLTSIELTRWDDYDAYWIRRGWAKRGPVKTMTRIDVPGRLVTPGTVRVAGVAWAPDRGIADVELRVDDGPWQSATCSDPLGDASWRQWWLDVELAPGEHVLQARAIDGTGAVQPEGPRDVLPDGAEGWYRIPVLARA